jgi:hypothetical protein
MAAKTLRKIAVLILDEIRVQILRKSGGKAADFLAIRCAKHCGFPVGKRRICGG